MAGHSKDLIYRILDVNFNRTAEGLRVCEEVMRFILNDRYLTEQLRTTRHKIFSLLKKQKFRELIKKRNSLHDVGRCLLQGELKRRDYQEIFFTNMQRVKESIRVLEEFYKLIDSKIAVRFKRIRYHVYNIEKKVTLKFTSLSDTRQGFLSSR